MTATDFADTPVSDAPVSDTSPALAPPPVDTAPPPPKFRLFRSRSDRKLGGVCGGLATALEIDATVIRIVFVGAAFAGFGIPVYLAAWILAPWEDEAR